MSTLVRPAERPSGVTPATQPCPLCQSDRSKPFVKAKDRAVVECLDCHLRALRPMPSIDELVTINEETVHPFFDACLEDEESYRKYFAAKLDDLQRMRPSGRLLDVGCGAGFFLAAARDREYDVSGLDLSPVPVRYARERLGLNVTIGSLYDYDAPDGSFDIVTIFQTIEHDPDPPALCTRLHRLLKPGGVLMVTTPAADGFVARVMGKRWFGYRNVEHVSFFTRGSLRYALETAGLEIISHEIEHGKRLTLKYVLNRLINYYYDHRASIRNGLRLLRPLLLVGKLEVFEPWAHLYTIARKPESQSSDEVPPFLATPATENGRRPA